VVFGNIRDILRNQNKAMIEPNDQEGVVTSYDRP
jgi:hypothetical protein